ncbi:cell division protein FtsN [Limnobaculum parvum]|nr:cell division protein FtsN [Limnobaculum parvum]
MIVLALAVLVVFGGGLYYITQHKPETASAAGTPPVKPGNGLPPKPEERWSYIKELENRQVTNSPNSTGQPKTSSPAPLTTEQRRVLDQIQADMQKPPVQLSGVDASGRLSTARDGGAKPALNNTAATNIQPQVQPQTQTPPKKTTPPAPTQAQDQAQTPPKKTAPPASAQAQDQAQTPPKKTAPPASAQAQDQAQTPSKKTTPPASAQDQAQTPPKKTTPPASAQDQAQTPPKKTAPPASTQPQEPTPKTTSQTAAQAQNQRWIIQCGSFKALDQAESVKVNLAFSGIESRISTSGGWNRVILGPYNNREAADKTLQRLKSSGVSNCIPVASGK